MRRFGVAGIALAGIAGAQPGVMRRLAALLAAGDAAAAPDPDLGPASTSDDGAAAA